MLKKICAQRRCLTVPPHTIREELLPPFCMQQWAPQFVGYVDANSWWYSITTGVMCKVYWGEISQYQLGISAPYCWSCFLNCTLPETNSSPLKIDRAPKPVFQPSTFRGWAVSFRECRSTWYFDVSLVYGIVWGSKCYLLVVSYPWMQRGFPSKGGMSWFPQYKEFRP